MEKVLLPLLIHENFVYNIIQRCNNNCKVLNTMKHVTNAISEGDVIETNIYTDQNWYLQNIHGFYTCAETSYHINKNVTSKNIPFIKLNFSKDLNQTSLKNINRKNVTNMQTLLPHKSIEDILYINKLLYHLVMNNSLDVIFDKIKNYNFNVKSVEVAIKIDKTLKKKKNVQLTSKNKKLLSAYFKNNTT